MSRQEDSDYYKTCLKAHGYTFLQDQTDEDKSESDEESRSMKPPPVPYRQFKHRIVKVPNIDAKTSKVNERKIERKRNLLNENKRKSNEIWVVHEKVKTPTCNRTEVMQELHLNKNNCINNESTASTLNQPTKNWLRNVEFEVNKAPVYSRIFERTQTQVTPKVKVPESNYLFEKTQNIHTHTPSVSTISGSIFCHENIAIVSNVRATPKPVTQNERNTEPQIQGAGTTKLPRKDYETDEDIFSIIAAPSRPNNMNTAIVETPLPISNAAAYTKAMDSVDLVYSEYQKKRKSNKKKKNRRCVVI